MNSEFFSPHKRFGIFGASESGKTTLAKKISYAMWRTEKRKSYVLDAVEKGDWGSHSKVLSDETSFWNYVGLNNEDLSKGATNGFVIVDDASVTINRDRELSGLFTTLRHRGHKLLVIGHGSENLLPQMRRQIQRIFLFLQDEKSIIPWETNFPGKDLRQAMTLTQYEFLTTANYHPLERFNLTK
jgi:hypothetical protein